LKCNVEPLVFFEGGLCCCLVGLHVLGCTGGWLTSASFPSLQYLQLFIVVKGVGAHGSLRYGLVVLRLGMMVFKKISVSVSTNGTA
jgi:hypothetical protein